MPGPFLRVTDKQTISASLFNAHSEAIEDIAALDVDALLEAGSDAIAVAAEAAAQGAVDLEIAGREILEGGDLSPYYADELSFAVVDEDGRRTWIEADAAGKPTTHAAGLIAEAAAAEVGEELGFGEHDPAVTELIFAVVDEDGRRTELELGPDGKFTQRVVNSLSERLNIAVAPVADPATFVLPSHLEALVGQTHRYWYANVIEALSDDHDVVANQPGNLVTHWEYAPAVADDFPLTLTVLNRAGATVTSTTTEVTAREAPDGTGKRHLAIGDSITWLGRYVSDAVAAIPGMTTVGTRTSASIAGYVHEGRPSWTLGHYVTSMDTTGQAESPFLYPDTVAGDRFWGNASFWKRVVATDPAAVDTAGLQDIARGWLPDPNPFLYDADGYPASPVNGDVVVDPSYSVGSRYRIYAGGSWSAMSPQPTPVVSFAKYLDRFAPAFAGGAPTSISFMLGTNDYLQPDFTDSSYATWKIRLDGLLEAIRAWDATVPVALLVPPPGGLPAGFLPYTVTKAQYDRKLRSLSRRMLADYDTPAKRADNVFVVSMLASIDAADIADHVHPVNPTGHQKMAPHLAGMLAKFVAEGL